MWYEVGIIAVGDLSECMISVRVSWNYQDLSCFQELYYNKSDQKKSALLRAL